MQPLTPIHEMNFWTLYSRSLYLERRIYPTQNPFPNVAMKREERSFFDATNLVRSGSTAAVTLLGDGELFGCQSHSGRFGWQMATYLDTLTLGQGNPGLVLTNDEDVAQTGSESVVNSVLDVDNVETTIVTLTVGDDTNTTHVATTGDHGNDTSVELDEVGDLASLKVDLDGVVDLDGGVGVADGAGIVRDEVRNALLAKLDTLHLAELVGSLSVGDAVDGETSLGVVDETEVLAGLLDRDDVHESSGEGGVSADLSVDLDEALHDDGLDLTVQPLVRFESRGAEKANVHTVRSEHTSVGCE
jgi:hypothetical protein